MTRSARAATLALLCSFAAHAAEPTEAHIDAKPAETKKEPIAKVEVKARADDYDPRRDDTASKTVMTQEEILKYGAPMCTTCSGARRE